MPLPQGLQKACIQEVDNNGSATGKPAVEVQFNPQSLKVGYSNQFSGGEQPKQGQARQFVGTSVTKLSMELWFDVTLPFRNGSFTDVREATQLLIEFLRLKNPTDKDQTNRVPPNLKFQWGSFIFTGTMDSLDETIDLFSPEGVPLRASVSISISKHNLNSELPTPAATNSNPIGTTPLATASFGDSLPQLAAQAGISDWQSVARANGIANPRTLQPGALIDLSISA